MKKSLKQSDKEGMAREKARPLPDPYYGHDGKLLACYVKCEGCERIVLEFDTVNNRCRACRL